MPRLGLLTGTAENSYGGLPTLPLVNLSAESAVTEPTQFALVSRPRLVSRGSVIVAGTGGETMGLHNDVAIYGDGGDLITPVNNVYVGGVVKGRMALRGPTSLAGNEVGTVMCSAGVVKFWDGTTLRDVTIPDDYVAVKVLESQGRFIFICAEDVNFDVAQRYYWTEPLQNMITAGDIVIDALDFASAETSPDGLLDGVIWNGNLVLAGYNTIEIHTPSGNDNLPWQALVGSVIDRGLLATGCIALWNGGIAWIDDQYGVYYSAGGGATRISNKGIEDALFSYTRGILLDSFRLGGREYLRARPAPGYLSFSTPNLPHYLFNAATGEWEKWASNGGGAFLGGPVRTNDFTTTDFRVVEFGSRANGQIIGFKDNPSGFVEDPLVYEFRCGVPIDGGAVTMHNIGLRCTTNDAGTISLRTSRDLGATWTAWSDLTLTGTVRQKVEWRARGGADAPGFLCDIKTANIDEFYISGAYFNEFVQGRGR